MLNAVGLRAYGARVSTQVLEGEYYVLVASDSIAHSYFLDPVRAIWYSFESFMIQKLSFLFDSKGIYVHSGIDMRPGSINLNDYISFTAEATNQTILPAFIPKKEPLQDQNLQKALTEAIKNDFRHRRQPQETLFEPALES